MSAITGVAWEVDVEALYTELQDRKEDLILAGLFGKSLLEEKEGLRKDLKALRRKYSSLEEIFESQKQDSLGALHEAEAAAEVAAALKISQLEMELENSQFNLKHDRIVALTSQQELQRSLKQMERENLLLKEELTQVIQSYKDEMKQFKNKLELSEEEKNTINFESMNTRKCLEELEEEKQRLERCLSSAQVSCEELTAELNISKQEAHFWENQYHAREHLLFSRENELGEAKDLLEQLEQELNQKDRLMFHHHVSPGVSLFDELSGITLQPHCEPSCASRNSMGLLNEITLSCDTNHVAVDDNSMNVQDSRARPCQRCLELEALADKQELELEGVNKQLLLAVEQKFKLHEQVEAWQSDVIEMVELKIKHTLGHHFRESNKYKAKNSLKGLLRPDMKEDNSNKDSHRRLAFQALKKLWIF